MREFKKLLVVLNPTQAEQVALNKAVRIAGHQDVEITALLLQRTSGGEFRTLLDQQLQQLQQQGLNIRLEISPETDLLRALLLCQHKQSFDLTLKEPHKGSLSDSLFTPLDWKLLRAQNTPVLMTRPNNLTADAPILAAVEAAPSDPEHQRLNQRILEQATELSDTLQRPLHLFSACPAPMQNPGLDDQDGEQQQAYREACVSLANQYGIAAERVHVDAGPAELLIADRAKTLDARLLVLGTVARTGLRGVLLGNTAEQLLERVDIDVLVIPPPRQDGTTA